MLRSLCPACSRGALGPLGADNDVKGLLMADTVISPVEYVAKEVGVDEKKAAAVINLLVEARDEPRSTP